MSEMCPDFSAIPHGRMMAIRQIEASLRMGETFEVAAGRARVASSTAKAWAGALLIRKSDLAEESPEARAARYVRWALGLSEAGRHDEAGSYEAEARKLETLLARLKTRAEAERARDGGSEVAAASVLVERVQAEIGVDADVWAAWRAIADFYQQVRALGGEIMCDGQVTWLDGAVPSDAPLVPGWMPCAPWCVDDAAVWARDVGAGLVVL